MKSELLYSANFDIYILYTMPQKLVGNVTIFKYTKKLLTRFKIVTINTNTTYLVDEILDTNYPVPTKYYLLIESMR